MLLTAPENKLGWHCQGPTAPATQDAKLRAERQETTAPGHACTITTQAATAAALPSHSQNSVCDRNMRRRQNIDAPSIIQDATDVSFTLHCVSKFEVSLNYTSLKTQCGTRGSLLNVILGLHTCVRSHRLKPLPTTHRRTRTRARTRTRTRKGKRGRVQWR